MSIDNLFWEIDTVDGYKTLRIMKEDKKLFLASKYSYKKDIDDFIKRLGELKEDSIIIVFGYDSGEYLKYLQDKVGIFTTIIIYEPNEEIYTKYKEKYKDSKKVFINKFNKDLIGNDLKQIINQRNYSNIRYSFFGNYNTVYSHEYYIFIKALRQAYLNSYSNVCTIISYKNFIWKNIYKNLEIVNDSVFFDDVKEFDKKTPALIISAGPSLDKNIEDLKNNKEKLKNFFIIANTRTVKPLITNGIKPDIICVVDGSDYMYEMMKEYLYLKIPLIYIEQSNNELLKKYSGVKILANSGILETMPQFEKEEFYTVYSGGSVAHTSIDIAVKLNCNPIVLCGQDLAYTFNKYHSSNSTNEFDKELQKEKEKITIKSVFGEKIYTDNVFQIFKDNLQTYINFNKEVEFINSSYGADIIGAKFTELEDVLINNKYDTKQELVYCKREKKYDVKSVYIDIIKFINQYIPKINQAIEKCKQNQNINESYKISINLKDIMDINQEFIDFRYIQFLNLFLEQFLIDISKCFEFDVNENKEIIKYSKKLSYSFEDYFLKLKNMLREIENIMREEG